MRPSPSMSAPEGSRVEADVSITITTSKGRISGASALARPETNTPQPAFVSRAPCAGKSI